jgi:hypothetical protein
MVIHSYVRAYTSSRTRCLNPSLDCTRAPIITTLSTLSHMYLYSLLELQLAAPFFYLELTQNNGDTSGFGVGLSHIAQPFSLTP